MQDKGINSTFKKIIYESSEMVFLADDSFPYAIFYANEAFEEQIGSVLTDRSLVGLGLDITAYIYKEELILTHQKKDYSFKLELPQESGANYFLFYKGREVKTHGFPSKKEAYQFFSSKLDLIAIGKYDHLTYLNPSVQSVLGFEPEELLNTNLCPLIHPEDLNQVRELWKSGQHSQELIHCDFRFVGKDQNYRNLECSVQFNPETFFVIARDVTHKVTQQKNELRLSSMRSHGPDGAKSGMWTVDLRTGVITVDAIAEGVFQSLFGEKDFKSKIIAQISPYSLETSSPSNDLKGEWIGDSGEKIGFSAFFPENNRTAIWGIVWDDSNYRLISEKLDFHTNLWQHSPEAMLVLNENGEILLANSQALSLIGKEKVSPQTLIQDLNLDHGKEFNWIEWIASLSQGNSVLRFPMTFSGKDGIEVALEISGSKTFQNGKPLALLSLRNISAQVKLEQKVEASSDFLKNLTEQVPGGLYQLVLNSEGQLSFSFLSKGITGVLGLTPEEVMGLTDISAAISQVHPMDLPMVIMSSVASAKKMEPWQCQFRVKTGDSGTDYRWVLGAARPQSLDNGDMVWYGYLTDISLQKEFEAKLIEARMAAEKASHIKSDFLSMISHELRTPLNAISGSVYSLFQEDPTDVQRNTLNTINFAVDNLIIMINDLLDFQKIEAGKLTIENSPFALKSHLEQILKGLSFHAKDSKNKLELHLSEGLDIEVKGDKTRLSQVMNNLITNALKFTNEGNVDVKVELVGQVRNKVRLFFEVKDTGIGIASENLEKIFEDFDQVKPSFSTKYGGTGLGLSITRKLLSLMGGKISVESEVGKGSRFFFELELEKIDKPSTDQPSLGTPASSPSSMHLLMAEDNDVNSLVLGKIIKKWGYTFERVLNGREAVDAVRKGTYDCILMDIQMPEMDGFEATVEIKKFSKIPVIALTAAAKLEIMEKVDACGFDGFVAKPIDAAELLKKIREVVAEKNYRA